MTLKWHLKYLDIIIGFTYKQGLSKVKAVVGKAEVVYSYIKMGRRWVILWFKGNAPASVQTGL